MKLDILTQSCIILHGQFFYTSDALALQGFGACIDCGHPNPKTEINCIKCRAPFIWTRYRNAPFTQLSYDNKNQLQTALNAINGRKLVKRIDGKWYIIIKDKNIVKQIEL